MTWEGIEGDSQSRPDLIQHAGWTGGQHGWRQPIQWTFASGWLGRSSAKACPVTRLRAALQGGAARRTLGANHIPGLGGRGPPRGGGPRRKRRGGRSLTGLAQRRGG